MTAAPRPRVALASVGLGRVQRGFERYFTDLFEAAGEEVDFVLFRSAGARGARQAVPPLLGAVTAVARRLPFSILGRSEYGRDCLAFGLCLLPAMISRRFDLIHCIDPPLAEVLGRLKRLLGLRTRILYTEGCLTPPELYPEVDHVHHVGREAFERALAAGLPEARMTLVPCGVDAARFRPPAGREQLRHLYGVGRETFVILAVSAIKREHKRVDHLVREVARLEGDVLLWLDGNPEDPELEAAARATLGNRVRITHVPSDRVAELYGLADVLVHGSLAESFGLVLVEAICSGLPVLAHDSPHFEWVTGDRTCLVDMEREGMLAARLRGMRAHRGEASREAGLRAAKAQSRFGWSSVTKDYVEMYRLVALREGGA